jgi:hypothetical protein
MITGRYLAVLFSMHDLAINSEFLSMDFPSIGMRNGSQLEIIDGEAFCVFIESNVFLMLF